MSLLFLLAGFPIRSLGRGLDKKKAQRACLALNIFIFIFSAGSPILLNFFTDSADPDKWALAVYEETGMACSKVIPS